MAILTHKRAKLLKYLKRNDSERYVSLLSRVGINRRAVEGEIVVPGRPKLITL
jgi:small subunit ribosomal protein S15